MFDPAPMLQMVRDWHGFSAEDPAPFLALASLRVAGFRIGSNQKSIVTRIDPQTIVATHHCLVGALVDKYAIPQNPDCQPRVLVARLVELANKVTDVFYANANSEPPLPIPHWYAGKEVCLFLQNGEGVPNPGEVMTYAEYLSSAMTGTKKLLDDLLAADVAFVQ